MVLELLLGRLEKLLNCGAKKIKVVLINELIIIIAIPSSRARKRRPTANRKKDQTDVIYYISIIARACHWCTRGRTDGQTDGFAIICSVTKIHRQEIRTYSRLQNT